MLILHVIPISKQHVLKTGHQQNMYLQANNKEQYQQMKPYIYSF